VLRSAKIQLEKFPSCLEPFVQCGKSSNFVSRLKGKQMLDGLRCVIKHLQLFGSLLVPIHGSGGARPAHRTRHYGEFNAAATWVHNNTKEELKTMAAKLWSISGLASETGRNFRTVSRALEGVRPDDKAPDGKPRWRMETAIKALADHTARTGRVPDKVVQRYDPALERQILEVERTAVVLDDFRGRLRSTEGVEERRLLVEREGKCVGAHERALQATVGEGNHAITNQLYVDRQMDLILRELRVLCEWTVADLTA
jgi:hypothetical protein